MIPHRRGGIPVAVLTTAIVLAACQSPLASWNAGLPGAIFRPSAGAWASGMGGAVSADPDYMLSWYNPSKLPLLRDSRASAGAGLRSLGRTEAWASYDFRVPPRVGMGLSFVYRGDPFVNNLYDGYYSGGELVEERPLDPAAWSAVSLKIGAGYLASRRLSVGGPVAVNYQTLPTTTTPTDNGAVEHTSVTSIGALDIAATYKATPALTLSASVRNLLARNSWYINSYDGFSPAVDEVIPPVFVLASSHRLTVLEREFVWNADAVIYLIDGEGRYTGHPEMVLAAGARWKFSDEITLKAGVADVELAGDLFTGENGYRDSFSPRAAVGFSYSLSKLRSWVIFNYSLMTDRIWAGVDQQFDITVTF
jgi:opacity protein-like surface antigen